MCLGATLHLVLPSLNIQSVEGSSNSLMYRPACIVHEPIPTQLFYEKRTFPEPIRIALDRERSLVLV